MKHRPTVVVIVTVMLLLRCSATRATQDSAQVTSAPIADSGTETRSIGPDSVTSLRLMLLAGTSSAESTRELPSSMEQILRSTVGPIPPSPSWAMDAWARPIVVSRSKRGNELFESPRLCAMPSCFVSS